MQRFGKWVFWAWMAMGSLPALADTPLRIAVVVPRSGVYQILGQAVQAGVNFAVRQAYKGIQVDVYDDPCDLAKLQSALTAMLKKKPNLIIGSLCFRTSRELGQAATSLGAVVINPVVQDPRLTSEGTHPFLFRLAGKSTTTGNLMLERAIKLAGKGGIALLDDGSLYGHGLVAVVKQGLTQRGLAPRSETSYTPGTTDFSVIAGQFALDLPAVVVVGGYSDDIGRLAQAVQASGLRITILSGDSLISTTASTSLGPAAPLVQFIGPVDPRETVKADVITALSEDTLLPDPLALVAQQAVVTYLAAVSKAGSSSADKVAQVLHTQTFDTPYGPLTFDANGDAAGADPLIGQRWRTYRDGLAVPVQ